MKYGIMPKAMWALFGRSFAKAAESELGVQNGKKIMHEAHKKYRSILAGVTEFDRNSRFVTNIISCAMLIAFLDNLEDSPTLEDVRAFYKNAMCHNGVMKAFVRMSNSYTHKGQEKLRQDAEISQKRENSYDWKFTYSPGETINQYTATFTTCGICTLMREYGYYDYVPAMCALDYDMAEMNNTVFTREYTLATGGPYCDCHYDHRGK